MAEETIDKTDPDYYEIDENGKISVYRKTKSGEVKKVTGDGVEIGTDAIHLEEGDDWIDPAKPVKLL